MMRKYLLLICLLVLFNGLQAFAQRQNVYYLKNNGKFVAIRDSADFVRIISEPDSGSTFFNLREFYINGAPKLTGKISRIETVTLEGQCLTFYPSGKRKQVATYEKGGLIGDVFDYYPNGNLYTVKQYAPNPKQHEPDVIIQTANDSTGKAQVVNGNGYYIGYNDKFEYIEEEGNVKAGLRDGDWKGADINKESKTFFTEVYANGKLISGQSTKDGDVVKYTRRKKQPEFKGGESGFNDFLSANIRYPEYEKMHSIVGKVTVNFVIEKDGSLTDIKVIKNPWPGLSAESVRVLKLSPNWIPGYYYGRPVRVQYTVPINFSLRE